MNDEAILSSSGEFTSFSYNGTTVRFRTSASLEKYIDIRKWDSGYIVVTARYSGADEEDYIDLIPILKNLYIDSEEFIKPIKKVRISYD